MKNLVYLLIFPCLLYSCKEKDTSSEKTFQDTTGVPQVSFLLNNKAMKYDSAYATATGADQYGMKQYVMAFLKAGPNRNQDSATAAAIQKKHLENITRMAEEGKLVVAGPFMDEWEVRGIYIFNVASLEEARKLTETDPAIKAGRLIMELHPWYGSAALMSVNKLHAMCEKKSVAE